MGASADERVGVIVKTCAVDVDKSKEASVNCCRSGSVPTRFTVVTVMSTATGALCDYIEDDLVYADGSIGKKNGYTWSNCCVIICIRSHDLHILFEHWTHYLTSPNPPFPFYMTHVLHCTSRATGCGNR